MQHKQGYPTYGLEKFNSIYGIYHFVSAKYLQRYVDEAVFRYNTRKVSEGERFAMMFRRSIGVVKYEQVRMAV